MRAFDAQVDDHIKAYETGTVTISDDIEFSMRRTVKQITHYILSRYMDGGANNCDPQTSKRRPFRNIGNAIVDIEWRAKNIDRKSIEGHASDGDYIFSLITNKELQLWMKNNIFGKTIDDYQRKKSEYGSVLLKKTERHGKLIIEPVQWENIAVDPNNILGGMKVEKSTLSLLELKKRVGVWDEKDGEEGKLNVDLAIQAAKKRKERDVEILDIEGEFEASAFDEEQSDDQDDTIVMRAV